MPKVRTGTVEKWVRRTSNAAGEYKAGVENPRASWKATTLAATASYKAGVAAAISNGSFEKGVGASSDEIWRKGATTLGADRFAGGVEAGHDYYAKGVAPYLAVIESTTLPPRGPKGDPKNYLRVSAMGQALRAKKMGSSGVK